ncbi:MAG: amino acid adenylation domain-containing protein, partial [Bacteroidia bacterium]
SLQLEEPLFKEHKKYWLDTLKGELPVLDLPSKKQRPEKQTCKGHGLEMYVDKQTTAMLKAYTEKNGGTLFTCMMAAWNVLMYHYTWQKDLITGTLVSGRNQEGLKDQIGFYMNTLVLRNEIDPEENFDAFYKRLNENTLKSFAHQEYPLDKLLEELDLQKHAARSAVNAMFILNMGKRKNRTDGIVVDLTEGKLNEVRDLGESITKFNIELLVEEADDYLLLKAVYNADMYEREIIEGLLRHYRQLLTSLLEYPQEKIEAADYLSEEEKHELLFTFNATQATYPQNKTIVELFEAQAAKTPHNTAVLFNEKKLSYKELDQLSSQLARHLHKNYSLQPDDLVGIQLDRSEWMVISILGVLKAGAAYVPVDPEYPSARKEYIVKDANLKLLITDTNFIHEIDYFEGNIFAIDLGFDSEKFSSEEFSKASGPNNLAYVIYTSGSTGKPKGVMVEHSSVVNTLLTQIEFFQLNSHSKGLQFASYSFDASVWETFLILLSGGSLHIISTQDRNDPKLLSSFIKAHKIDIATLPPSYQSKINIEELKSLRKLITAGESPIYDKALKQLQNGTYYNAYGPTEASICATIFKLENKASLVSNNIPIGKPIPNAAIYILNQQQRLQPAGAIGEICIGGAGLARGYLNREELTKEKFVKNPFKEGERLYKTGDLGRWQPDGNLEFVGRKDQQVKIRGYRIELGEIEHALQSYKPIETAVVLAKTNQHNEKELVAYITSKEQQNTNGLRSYLKELLPEYMLPSHYVQLETFPLTPNGKIDRNTLPDPEEMGLKTGVEYVAPRTIAEKVLVETWSDVLKRAGIGVKDNFYNLGGDSIKSIQVVSRLKQKGYLLKVEHILRTPVLEELTGLMQQSVQVTDQSEIEGSVEFTPIQHWFFSNPEIKVHHHYNQSVLLKSKERINENLLEKSIAELTRHHDALRMVYKKTGELREQINQNTNSKNYAIDFYDLSKAANPFAKMSVLGEQLQASLNITDGPLVKVVHFRLKDGDRLGLIIHHLVVDGVSWRILLEDLSNLYTSYKEERKVNLPLKTDSFQKWAILQKEFAQGKKIQKESAYWKEISNQKIKGLPLDKKEGAGQSLTNSVTSFSLDKHTTELLQTRVHSAYNTEINDVLLAGLGLAVKEVFKTDKVVLKMEGHGREEIIEGVDISRTVGWFTTTYPFVLNVSGTTDPIKNLIAVKEGLRKIPNKGIGYGILKYLSPHGIENEIIPEIVFNYLGDFGSNAGNNEKSIFEYAYDNIGPVSAQENENNVLLDVSGILVKGELSMSVRYLESRYDPATIEKLIKSYEHNLKFLIEELSKKRDTHLTPSDLSFKGLSADELSDINADNSVEDVYELSPLQEGIYYLWLSEKFSLAYFEQMSYRVRAKGLEIAKLKRAYEALIARHGVLRTSFSNDYAGRPLQIVRKKVPGNFSYENIKDVQDKQRYVEEVKKKDREKGFDLSSPSQMRLHII